MFYLKDTMETIYHFDDNQEYTHKSTIMIRKHTGLPAKCTLSSVPNFDVASERCYFIDENWVKTTLYIGRLFWTENAEQECICSYGQKMPQIYSLCKPPKAKKGFVVKLKDNVWEQIEDHRSKLAYAKDRDNSNLQDYYITQIGSIPETHTLSAYDLFDSWIDGLGWQYDAERHKKVKGIEEREWRDSELTRILNRIDQYEKDQRYPIEYRTSPIQDEVAYHQLLMDRKNLSNYPNTEGFPFGERPL